MGMKKCSPVPVLLLSLFLASSLPSAAWSYGAEDYYKAGLQLYNAQNYAQAVQYFGAALGIEPNNTAALQGRANCFYALGKYQEALADYEKVQSLAPSDPLSQFIQTLRAKTGAAPQAALPPSSGADAMAQGAALYRQGQYAAAVPYFQKAEQADPADANASYYLGASYMGLGDMKDAALHLALSDKKRPDPSVAAYVARIKERLAPEDRQWVEERVAAGGNGGGGATGPYKKLEVRLTGGIVLLNLADFEAGAEGNKAEAAYIQSVDPTATFSGSVPTGCPEIGLEASMRFSPELEIGGMVGFLPVGTASNETGNGGGQYSIADSYALSAITGGLCARYFFGAGAFQPFLGAGLLLTMVNIDYQASFNEPIGTATASGNFTGMGFGGRVQAGLDWHLGDSFTLSPFVGYQMAGVNDLSADMGGGKVQLQVVPTSNGSVITPVSGGNLVMPVADNGNVWLPGSPAPSGSKPLSVDMSGLTGGVQLSMSF